MKTRIEMSGVFKSILAVTLLLLVSASRAQAQKKPLTFADIMKFKQIESPVISDDGNWVAYSAQPDRGDGEVKVHSLASKRVYTIPRGARPTFSKDARWVVMSVKPTAIELEKKEKDKDKPKSGMALLNTGTGDTLHVQAVESFFLSEDSRWLAYLKSKDEKKSDSPKQSDTGKDTAAQSKPKKKKETVGSDLFLRNLQSGKETRIPFAALYAFDSTSHFLAFVVADTVGGTNGVYVRDLRREGQPEYSLLVRENGTFTHLSWCNANTKLAFVAATLDDKEKPGPASLWLWNPAEPKATEVVPSHAPPTGWILPSKNDLVWTKDGKRLFFGFRPLNDSDKKPDEKKDSTIDVFDADAILKKREVDVWHWNDPRIIANQKKRWKDEKDRIYRAVYHVNDKRLVFLADLDVPVVDVSDNPNVALGRSNVPYLKASTWNGEFNDVYLVDLNNGTRERIASRLDGPMYLSSSGRHVLYYHDKQWFLYNTTGKALRNLTEHLPVAFFDEEDDTPDPPAAYGFGGWVDGGRAAMLYDKYDIWQAETETGKAMNLTGGHGRKTELSFRVQKLDPDAKFFKDGEQLFLTAYHDQKKHMAFYAATLGKTGVARLVEEPKRFTFLAKAKHAEKFIYTRQSYSEFPDVWVSDLAMKSSRRVSDINPQITDFAWGSAELVDWSSLDGTPLQGVLIKPGNFDSGKRYPVLVYFYELSSQRLHEFNQVVVNHRPCFPFYASNGYAVFLPDVRFEIGRPGLSATKCIVPGVQKLIDMGVADPKAIALHGHSWSGYETAFMITQTNLFACAIAGAVVANMTSAYSGIRQETGLARQFQYEQEQSRIGGSLWEYPERYIENSPVFFADKIKTPLLVQAGDEDEAVPWQQNVELYLAMRRLEKPCWFLQYRGESHHLKKYPNKLDYSIKFKEFLDHYLKGMPAPDWMVNGVPFSE
jgi:dipeptidyl aminopeptidase/acylaminoacyl peptidase